MGFDPQWLEARFVHDHGALNRELLGCLVGLPRQSEAWRVLDLGSGTGANVRHGADLLQGTQHWTLVDEDAALLAEAPLRLAAWAGERGWKTSRSSARLEIRRPGGLIVVDVVPGDIVDVLGDIEHGSLDLVTANAVFDLLPPERIEACVDALASLGLPLWATLNYENMTFSREMVQDRTVVEAFHEHMTRPQAHGRNAGPRAIEVMREVLRRRGYVVHVGPSDWNVANTEDVMWTKILKFIEESVPEMLDMASQGLLLEEWLYARKTSPEFESVRVHHEDLLAIQQA